MNVTAIDSLSRYLDLTAEQMKLTAGNLANVDTPGYKTQGFDFEREFSESLQMSSTSKPVPVSDVSNLVARPDGNTVSTDRESMNLAKAQLQFKVGVEFLRHEFNQLLSAIHLEGK